MTLRRLLLPPTALVLLGASCGLRAQAAAEPSVHHPMGTLLLVVLVAGGLILLLRPRRPSDTAPPPANPYARDDAFGRPAEGPGGPGPAYGGGYPGDVPPAGVPGGLGSALARGVATGLAVGAGAAVASELGHRMFEHGRDQPPPDGGSHAGLAAADHAANLHSPLARDAGLGALDGSGSADPGDALGGAGFGIADAGNWDDPGAGFDDLSGGDWDR